MRVFLLAVFLGCGIVSASILPTFHLNNAAILTYQRYIDNFEKSSSDAFAASGVMWIDRESGGKITALDQGKTVMEPRQNADIEGGSIHHFSGTIRVPGGTIENLKRVMQDYPHYPKYFSPDVASATGKMIPDSSPRDEHYESKIFLVQSTIWLDVAYQAVYDTHFLQWGDYRFESKSTSTSIKELRNAKTPADGTFPEGDDHGFLWKTNTYWFARERNGGLDIEADSITLSRPIPTGFAWYGTKRTKEAVDKMLRDTKAAMQALPKTGSAQSGL